MFRNSINRGHEFDNNLLWLFKLKTLKAHLFYCDPPLSRRFRNSEPSLLKCLVRIRIKSRGKHRWPLDSDELSNDVLSSVFRRYFDLFNFNSQVVDSECEAFEIFSNPNSLTEWMMKFSTVFLTFECFNNHDDHSNETSLVSTDNFYIVVLLIYSILRINESWNSLIVWLWLLLKVDELIIFHVITILEDFITSFKKTMRQLSVDTCLVFYWMGDQAKY